jgi:hypothetical protein
VKLLRLSFTFWQSLSNFRKDQILVSITVSSLKWSDISYIWVPSFMYQDDVGNMIVSPPGECQVYLWMLRCGKMVLLTIRFFKVGKFTSLSPLTLLISENSRVPCYVEHTKLIHTDTIMGRNIWVSDANGCGIGVHFPATAGYFLLLQSPYRLWGPSNLIEWVLGVLCPWVRWPECGTDHSPSSSKAEHAWSCNSTHMPL